MDGRVITQVLDKAAPTGGCPTRPRRHHDRLGNGYKQLNAPFGAFGLDTLVASTTAIKSTDELVYDSIETKIANLTFARGRARRDDPLRARRRRRSAGGKIDPSQARDWIKQAQSLIDQAHALATLVDARLRRARARATRRARALRASAPRTRCDADASRGGRRPRTSASPGGSVPRGSSARPCAGRGAARCAGAVRPSSRSMPCCEQRAGLSSLGVALDLGDVGLLDAVARMREPVRELRRRS